jgi:acyl-CoA thioester hydrolase
MFAVAEPRLDGPEGMYGFDFKHRVRYRECDGMGFIYHAHYIDYFEAARTEALRSLGVSVRELEAEGIVLPVIDLAVTYKRPGHYDDQLVIRCTIAQPPGVRLRTGYEVYRAGEPSPLCTAHVTVCFFDARRRQPIPAPNPVIASISRAIQTPGVGSSPIPSGLAALSA